MNLFEVIASFIQKGGFFVYPIILCSVIGLAIFLQKMWVLRRKNIIPTDFITRFIGLLSEKQLNEAKVYADSNDSSIARIASAALDNMDRDKEELREKMEEAGKREAIDINRYTEGLGSISNVSTLLGLLGTISGMIKIFSVISEKPVVNPPELAGGISEALYTTAFGLVVAIPAFIAYKYIIGRSDEWISILEQEGLNILDYLTVSEKDSEV